MGFRLKVDGPQTIELGVTSIMNVEYESDSPNDSNARSTDYGVSMKLRGKINYSVGGEEADSTINLGKWSLVPSERADCYRSVTVDIIAASQIVRQTVLPNAFVVDYTEEFDDEEGVGVFYLHVKQKKDKTTSVKLEGGFGE